MEEQLISLMTAKLAKQKGFCTNTTGTYEWKNGCELVPQSLLQRWLREVHNIDITIALVGHAYGFYIHKERAYTNKGENYGVSGHNYEKALEAGLQKALTLLPVLV